MKNKPSDNLDSDKDDKELSNKIEQLMGPPDADLIDPKSGPSLYKPKFKNKNQEPNNEETKSQEKTPEKPIGLKDIPSAPPIKDDSVKTDKEKIEPPKKSPKETEIEKINEEISSLVKEKEQVVNIKQDEQANQEINEEISDTDDQPDDPLTSKAIDEIVAKEGDEVLEAEDAKTKDISQEKPKRPKKSIKKFLMDLWENPKSRKILLISLVAILLTIFLVPLSRYFTLNLFGVRASASLTVLDNSTQQPLKNVNVKIGKVTRQTDNNGKVKLNKLKLGSTNLIVEKRAFAEINQKITVGFGSNPLGEFKITPVGLQYTFIVKDFLSAKPIQKAEASSGESSAFSDKDGKIVLTVDDATKETLEVSIKASSYREEKVKVSDNKIQYHVKMVPSKKHVFVSKRSGKYDVYKIDADGKNEEKVLAGSGIERDDIVLIPHPSDNVAAYISTRENVRNKDGFLLSTLTLIDLNTNSATKVAQSERIQAIDWIGDNLIYVKIAAGASANDPKRHRLMAYDYKNDKNNELASSNYFNDVLVASGSIYVAPSASYQHPSNIGLFKISADGKDRKIILDKEVWNIFRLEYDKLSLAVQQDWYEYKIGDLSAQKISSASASPKTKVFIDSPNKEQSIWVDQRDGKGVLLDYSIKNKIDKEIKKQSSLGYPIRWLSNNVVIYRVSNEQETADYVINIDGGDARKIIDVTNSGGIDKWYYY